MNKDQREIHRKLRILRHAGCGFAHFLARYRALVA